MDWLKIGSAALLIAMLFLLYPRMLHAFKHSPKGTAEDWKSFFIPLVAVVAFVALLIMMV